jgi:hypothetical protein
MIGLLLRKLRSLRYQFVVNPPLPHVRGIINWLIRGIYDRKAGMNAPPAPSTCGPSIAALDELPFICFEKYLLEQMAVAG